MNLTHPFALNISDLEDLNLDFAEQLTAEETAQISGGLKQEDKPTFTTLALGEEGGQCISAPCPGSENGGEPLPQPPKPPKPPVYTKAWLEGGGLYTKALHENGGSICW